MSERNARKVRLGIVVAAGRDKTVTVEVSDSVKHPKYGKVMRRSSKFHVHDETNDARTGDTVRIIETRPLSKTKRWRLDEIVERAR